MNVDIYKSLLFELSQLPEEQLLAVSSFIDKLKGGADFDKEQNRKVNLAILTEDSEWDDAEFEAYRETIKTIGEEMFNPRVETWA